MNDIKKIITLSLPILFMAIGSGWLGDTITNSFTANYPWWISALQAVIAGILFFGGAARAYKLGKEYLPIRVLSISERIPSCKVLITTISTKTFKFSWPTTNQKNVIIKHKWEPKEQTLTGVLSDDVVACSLKWNWQQILRAVAPHIGTLERIHLIGSADKEKQPGSAMELPDCKRLLAGYVGGGISIVQDEDAIDFEDIDALERKIEQIIKDLKKENYKEADIMIDSTGGHKTTSIAVALVTLSHPRLHFQYVSMHSEKPLAFNVVAEKQANLG